MSRRIASLTLHTPMLRRLGCALALLPLTLGVPDAAHGAEALPTLRSGRVAASAAAIPNYSNRIHRVGGVRLGINNIGTIGGIVDTCLGRYGDIITPGFEFPAGSGLEYISGGALWVGAVRGRDTLVSTGMDGWSGPNEMWPPPAPGGMIYERTNRKALRFPSGSPCPDIYFSPDAVSDEDFVTTYYDTLTRGPYVISDVFDGRRHVPLGLEILQKSYSWSFNEAQGFIIIEYEFRNMSEDPLRELYIGLYMDNDVYHISKWRVDDDITGFLHTVPAREGSPYLDTINVPWIADNDGDPTEDEFDYTSPTGVAAVRVLRAPRAGLKFSFNWWVSNADRVKDWGPNRTRSTVVYIPGNLGTPMGDKAKYQVMSNGEFDYDQVESALNHEVDGWLPPVNDARLAADLADGFDTRYLLSFGPFKLASDSVLPLTIAVIGAQEFHTDPLNFRRYFDPYDPRPYYSKLNFKNLGNVARWAGWVYDVPGLDTDGDGYRGKFRVVHGDTSYYEGDGVPDYRNPPPPPGPLLRYRTEAGRITLLWNGEEAETSRDPFSLVTDFEGYRVYMSRTGRVEEFALLSQRDRVDYTRYLWRRETHRWTTQDPPFTLDSLKALYLALSDSTRGYPFHPDSFKVKSVDRALLEIVLDEHDPSRLDSNYYVFAPHDANAMADDLALADAASRGALVAGVIRKTRPDADPTEVDYRDDGTPFHPYWEYEYVLDRLNLAEPVLLSVTTFDFGNPAIGLPPIESAPNENMEEVWPINSAEVVGAERPKPGVYPNPYRIVDNYYDLNWENRKGLEPDRERARQVTFYNVPDTCVVSLWSIDGDLVRRLEHRADPSSSDATVVTWNLITRNTQAVKTGIYIYSIESRFGTDVGKLVIIK